MKFYRIIIFVSAFLLLYSCSDYKEKYKQPVVENGVADLSAQNFSSDRIVELSGEWEFYCNRLLEPGDFKLPSPEKISYIQVPDKWDEFLYNGKRLGSWGYATYRLTIFTGNDKPLYFKLMPPNSAYKIWVNGTYSGECGKIGKSIGDEIPEYKLAIFELIPVNKKIEIIIQVSNQSIYLGGILLPAIIGPREEIYDEKNNKIAFDIFVFASLLVISIYYFGLFLMRRSDRSNLFFSIFTLMLAVRSLVTNEMFLYQLLPHADWQLMYKIDFLSTTLCVPVFLYFIYLLYPVVVTKQIRGFFILCSVFYASLILCTHTRFYSIYLPLYNFITILACIFIFYVLIRAVIDRQDGAKLAFTGFAILFATVTNDILSVNSIIHTIQLSSFGVFAFILLQSLISSMKFADAYNSIEDLSHNLEIKVNLRTKELEEEKELLRSRNEKIENELIIAKQIQMQIIPRVSPVEYIHAFYKPMDKVGGDFYDFMKYRNPEKIGIFLSDVSGHGVPAAFITSMIKTSILQAGTDREDPAHMLASLNELLLDQTGGNFVTAFYGIYNPVTREMIYSNCGHNPPFILSSGIVETIKGKKTIPLAIMDNETLKSKNKNTSNNSMFLKKGDRILFYTDGLTETVEKNDRSTFFENLLINELIVKYSGNSPKHFINNIYDELIRFHGSDYFEDDICMICMDIE